LAADEIEPGLVPEQVKERKRDRLRRYARDPFATGTSDLPKRALSAVVMLAVAGTALWMGGAVLNIFIGVVALICFAEFAILVFQATSNPAYRGAALLAGIAYIGTAAFALMSFTPLFILISVLVVVFIDSGAYFAGRSIGGPKIAPSISPSKTWAGLFGGMVAASVFMIGVYLVVLSMANSISGASAGQAPELRSILIAVAVGSGAAILAQSGDFLESWLKRKANRKDSSNLIPGHGGVFDRIDGVIPVVIALAVAFTFYNA
jgi:phosphatidate cytidylyltransferase